uniref:Uncharacterized protein n=1 Tax=Aegilops tauschii subsp. strangulata TaxID=200361 RepID=A0A453M0I7_AEGTS
MVLIIAILNDGFLNILASRNHGLTVLHASAEAPTGPSLGQPFH